MQSSQIWSTPGSSLPAVSWGATSIAGHYWNLLNTACRICTALFLSLRKNPILSKANFIGIPSGLKRYGKSKEHRPNPIVTMGLFMDADGIPMAFDIFPGNQNEQTTLKPLESKILQDFGCSEFIFCSDAGLGSTANRRFNSLGNRAYVITHSLKKMKKEERDIALNPAQFRKPGYNSFINLRTLDETDEEVFHTVYYKEIPVVTGSMDETIIVTYSPKYKAYQRRLRARQIERAQKIIASSDRKRKGKNQNDPMRFVKKISVWVLCCHYKSGRGCQ